MTVNDKKSVKKNTPSFTNNYLEAQTPFDNSYGLQF